MNSCPPPGSTVTGVWAGYPLLRVSSKAQPPDELTAGTLCKCLERVRMPVRVCVYDREQMMGRSERERGQISHLSRKLGNFLVRPKRLALLSSASSSARETLTCMGADRNFFFFFYSPDRSAPRTGLACLPALPFSSPPLHVLCCKCVSPPAGCRLLRTAAPEANRQSPKNKKKRRKKHPHYHTAGSGLFSLSLCPSHPPVQDVAGTVATARGGKERTKGAGDSGAIAYCYHGCVMHRKGTRRSFLLLFLPLPCPRHTLSLPYSTTPSINFAAP